MAIMVAHVCILVSCQKNPYICTSTATTTTHIHTLLGCHNNPYTHIFMVATTIHIPSINQPIIYHPYMNILTIQFTFLYAIMFLLKNNIFHIYIEQFCSFL
jgi:hypothetical protein